jgi:hypothetical protein
VNIKKRNKMPVFNKQFALLGAVSGLRRVKNKAPALRNSGTEQKRK